MMKNNDISRRDWESLSAYIDGELTPVERNRLEERLQAREDLHAALEALRKTQIVLRSQGSKRAPRNFTLTPEMAGVRSARRQPAPLFPVFRLASALASILLVLVLFGDFLAGGSLGALAPSANPSAPQIAAVTQEVQAEKAEEPKQPQLEMPVQEQGESAQTESPQALRSMTLPSGTPGVGGGAAESSEMLQSSEAPPGLGEETPPPAIAAAPRSEETQTSQAFGPSAETLEHTQIVAPEGAEDSAQPRGELPTRPPVSPWRVVEIVLAGIALISGVIAFTLRRAG
jgi:anti-sigma factor RsiW